MSVRVVYAITPENELKIEYFATSDKDTVVNLTNHSYFNLAGHAAGDILQHELMINADHFTPTDSTSIPTGELRGVKGTPFDFTQPTAIGLRASQSNEQLTYGHGYDHNFSLNPARGCFFVSRSASSRKPKSGRILGKSGSRPSSGSCSFTAAIFLMVVFMEKAAQPIRNIRDSAWRRSIFRIRPINPIFHRPHLKRVCNFIRRPCSGFSLNRHPQKQVVSARATNGQRTRMMFAG